jgi:hypothetical protein
MPKPAWYRRRGFLIALVAVLATLSGVRLGVGIWGRSRLAAYVQGSEAAWSEERARLEKLANPLDPTQKAPCASAYATAGVDLGAGTRPLGLALVASPRTQVPDEARAIVQAERGAIDVFLRASQCGAYAPAASQSWVAYSHLYPTFQAARLVIVDGRMRAQAGDLDGALDRWIAAVKAGTDLGEGTLLAGVVGVGMSAPALREIAALVEDGRLSAEQRDRLARALDALGPRMVTFPRAVHRERVALHPIARAVYETGAAPEGAQPTADDPVRFVAKIMPVRAVFADAMRRQDRYYADIEALAVSERDRLTFLTRLIDAEPRATSRRLTGMDFPPYGLAQQGHALCVPLAWQRVIRAALAVEASGAVPGALPSPIEDPCGAGSLVYARTAAGGYLIESVGKDSVVSDDDPRIDRAPAPPQAPSL